MKAVFTCLVLLLMTTHAAEDWTRIFTRSGEAVVLTFDLEVSTEKIQFRWKTSHKLITTKNGTEGIFKERCELLTNGSLRFDRVQTNDSGNYSVEVFNESSGKLLKQKRFQLIVLEPVSRPVVSASCFLDGRVVLRCSVEKGDPVWIHWKEATTTGLTNQSLPLLTNQSLPLPLAASDWPALLLGRTVDRNVLCVAKNNVSEEQSAPVLLECRGWVSAVMSVLVCNFLLLSSLLILILRKRRRQRRKMGDPLQENIYMSMHSNHGDRQKDEEKNEGGEESLYVLCASGISTATPITGQTAVETDDIYV